MLIILFGVRFRSLTVKHNLYFAEHGLTSANMSYKQQKLYSCIKYMREKFFKLSFGMFVIDRLILFVLDVVRTISL